MPYRHRTQKAGEGLRGLERELVVEHQDVVGVQGIHGYYARKGVCLPEDAHIAAAIGVDILVVGKLRVYLRADLAKEERVARHPGPALVRAVHVEVIALHVLKALLRRLRESYARRAGVKQLRRALAQGARQLVESRHVHGYLSALVLRECGLAAVNNFRKFRERISAVAPESAQARPDFPANVFHIYPP